jgi:hypothetical protein
MYAKDFESQWLDYGRQWAQAQTVQGSWGTRAGDELEEDGDYADLQQQWQDEMERSEKENNVAKDREREWKNRLLRQREASRLAEEAQRAAERMKMRSARQQEKDQWAKFEHEAFKVLDKEKQKSRFRPHTFDDRLAEMERKWQEFELRFSLQHAAIIGSPAGQLAPAHPLANLRISFMDIPWPAATLNLHDVFKNLAPEERKRVYRKLVLRWHPDKFQQNFGHHLNPQQRDKIMDKVTGVSATINGLRKL